MRGRLLRWFTVDEPVGPVRSVERQSRSRERRKKRRRAAQAAAIAADLALYGTNRKEIERLLLALGGAVHWVRRTGDRRYTHPAVGGIGVKANGRRKDSTRLVVAFVREVQKALAERSEPR